MEVAGSNPAPASEANLGKDLDRGWDQVVFCAVAQETLDRLRELVIDTVGPEIVEADKVRFVLLGQFLNGGPSGQDKSSGAEG